MSNDYKGCCLCGTVTFEVSGAINDIVMCHCSLCRKAQGSAYATNANVAKSDFKLSSGENNLTEFKSTAVLTKAFCKTCGSPVYSRHAEHPEIIRIRLGLIESQITERPVGHVFVDSKAEWETITGDIPQYSEYLNSEKL